MNSIKWISPAPGSQTTQVYVVAAVAVTRSDSEAMGEEHILREALGQGDGEVLFIADDALKINKALEHLNAAQMMEDEAERPNLTPRETEVLSMVAKGLRSGEIADVLEMSLHTVNTHLKNMFRKLGVRCRSEAVFEATRLGLIQPY